MVVYRRKRARDTERRALYDSHQLVSARICIRYSTKLHQTQEESGSMSGKSDIFVDAAMKPYNFYLCPPLNRSERLVDMVKDNGGRVVHDFLENCIVISSPDYVVPEDLKTAHIYSYEVIQDSANRGAQQEFANYLIHVPTKNRESVPHQYSERKLHTGAGSGNDLGGVGGGSDDYNFDVHGRVDVHGDGESSGNGGDGGHDDENRTEVGGAGVNHLDVHGSELIFPHGKSEGHIATYDDHSVRYFTDEEDKVLMEEIRKRHWMGIKGHSIYEAISKMPYFVSRRRTPASLRERMRTLKYKVGYVYKVDKKNRLLKDANGNYIKTTQIASKLTPYTAEDDLLLCKTIYLKLDIVTDDKGFESVVFPTNFFDKFAIVYDTHTPESWRQRYKNYLSIFGIANYIKYYIMEVKNDEEPLPANIANKEWLQARKHIKKTDCPRLYFPNIPQENEFIDENLYYIALPAYDTKIFEFDNPFRNIKKEESEGFSPEPTPSSNVGTAEETNETEKPIEEATAGTDYDSFADEPTTEFIEVAFKKSYRKYGPPIDLAHVSDKKALINIFKQIFSVQGEKLAPRELSKRLLEEGVQEYYTVFLIYRCNSIKSLVLESLLNYVDTDGAELLVMKPGIWSNKCIEMFEKHDPKLEMILKRYHGEKGYVKQARWLKMSKMDFVR